MLVSCRQAQRSQPVSADALDDGLRAAGASVGSMKTSEMPSGRYWLTSHHRHERVVAGHETPAATRPRCPTRR